MMSRTVLILALGLLASAQAQNGYNYRAPSVQLSASAQAQNGFGFKGQSQSAQSQNGIGFQGASQSAQAQNGFGFQGASQSAQSQNGIGFQGASQSAQSQNGIGFQRPSQSARPQNGFGFQGASQSARPQNGFGFQGASQLARPQNGFGFQGASQSAQSQNGFGFQGASQQAPGLQGLASAQAQNGLGFQGASQQAQNGLGFQGASQQAPGYTYGVPGGPGLEGSASTLNEIAVNPEINALASSIGGDGVPGEDYPILASVPETGFSCEDQGIPGYYADDSEEAGCQVFHICQFDGRQDSFLCPNGTLFNQQYFVCDWWYNVDCSATEDFIGLNADIGRVPGDDLEGSASELSLSRAYGAPRVAAPRNIGFLAL